MNADYWINKLKLKLHPEGGYYAESYKSVDYKENEANRTYSSSLIYFLLKEKQISAFHKLKSDEVWIYHKGTTLKIYIINEQGELRTEYFGSAIDLGEKLQVIIPANSWFAAELVDQESFSLMTCMVTPGFKWNDFELANMKDLIKKYPQHKALIETRCK